MPCPHKFQCDLNLENLDFHPTELMIGTFSPSWPKGNRAEWFYGRTSNNYFWDVLPRMFDPETSLMKGTARHWKDFCKEKKVALTDMISCINDAEEGKHDTVLKGYVDLDIATRFHDFDFTDISGILCRYTSIKNVYLTRQAGIQLFDEQWDKIRLFAQSHLDRKVNFKMLLTPSKNARFHMDDYKETNPGDPKPLRNFIYQSWQKVWHH
ncbi:hypothetical protein [Flaviaesturariibacter aridisoli]|uniref:Uracil-DNA glycosylase family protein n=1 Tax=Flaviaesturariibacter aridisoli TaxID=2545761 RepID=A0A4R4DWK5_9BACT|nr:hypothetical protein [Flaviaesturariibacter aridisoli]TCZ65186.1 hypothetical protein E0486_17705 [Flaviaesturariibacter aridisoli]